MGLLSASVIDRYCTQYCPELLELQELAGQIETAGEAESPTGDICKLAESPRIDCKRGTRKDKGICYGVVTVVLKTRPTKQTVIL